MQTEIRHPGWVKLHRKIIDSAVFASPELLKMWLLCLSKANYTEAHVYLDGVAEPVKVKPGQFIIGRYSLYRAYYQSESESNKSPLTLWRWLKRLESMGNLNIYTNNKYSIVEIVNWVYYQNNEGSEQLNEQQLNNRRTTAEQQVNTEKKEKKGKKRVKGKDKKEFDRLAETIYKVYPRSVGKSKALESIKKALKKVEYDDLIDKVKLFAKSVNGQDKQYIPYPATWFNQKRWEDDPAEWVVWKEGEQGAKKHLSYNEMLHQVTTISSRTMDDYQAINDNGQKMYVYAGK